jgi:hypothetical protein
VYRVNIFERRCTKFIFDKCGWERLMKTDERIEGMISNHSEHTRLVARAELGLFFWWRCKATISVGSKLQIIPYHKVSNIQYKKSSKRTRRA